MISTFSTSVKVRGKFEGNEQVFAGQAMRFCVSNLTILLRRRWRESSSWACAKSKERERGCGRSKGAIRICIFFFCSPNRRIRPVDMLRVLLPGDLLPSTSADTSASLIVGPGLQLLSKPNSLNTKGKGREAVVSNRAGLLGHVPSTTQAAEGGVEKWWIEGSKKRVRPQRFASTARRLPDSSTPSIEVLRQYREY